MRRRASPVDETTREVAIAHEVARVIPVTLLADAAHGLHHRVHQQLLGKLLRWSAGRVAPGKLIPEPGEQTAVGIGHSA